MTESFSFLTFPEQLLVSVLKRAGLYSFKNNEDLPNEV
jgi:hypothetical protein